MTDITDTLVYSFLQLEEEIQPVPPSVYDKLNKIKNDFEILYQEEFPEGIQNNQDEVKTVVQLIENTLLKNNVICKFPVTVHFMSDGLIGEKLSEWEIHGVDFVKYNYKRLDYIKKHKTELFYKIDCDVGCFIYYCLAEIFNFPYTIAETEEHNFIRLIINKEENTFFDWDTNYGHERHFTIAHTLTHTEIEGYFYFVRGIAWGLKRDFDRAIEDYLKADLLYKNYFKVKCNIAWLYISEPEVINDNRRDQAVIFAKDAVELYRHDINLHCYACALAEKERFEEAIEYLKIALKTVPFVRRSDYQRLLGAFKERKTYIQEFKEHRILKYY